MASVTSGGETIKAAVPLAKCQKCFGDAYMTNIEFVCSDCHGIFEVDARAIKNADSVYYIDPTLVKERIDFSDVDIDKPEAADVTLRMRGDLLKHIQYLRNKYKLGSLSDTAFIFFMAMYEITSMLERTTSKYIGLVNEAGTKSSNLKDGSIFHHAKKVIMTSKKDSKVVSQFLEDISHEMKLKDIKEAYDKIDMDHLSKWDFEGNKDNADKHIQ